MFHIQMDEVGEWCQCPQCRDVAPGQLYVQHLLKLAGHLADKGIQHIGAWEDMLLRHGQLSEGFAKTLEEHGLKDKLILHWFMYGPDLWEDLKPELGLRSWMAPMTGFQHNYLAAWGISHMRNLYQMLRLGQRDGAEGAEPYALYDFGYHRSHCCLAEFSWNQPSGPDAEEEDLSNFLQRYARRFFGDEWAEAISALEGLDRVYETPIAGRLTVLSALSHYTYSCPPPPDHAKIPYPEEPLRLLRADPEHQRKLQRAAGNLARINNWLASLDRSALEVPQVADSLEAECVRFASLAHIFLLLLTMEESYQCLRECAASDRNRAWALLEGISGQARQVQQLQQEAMSQWEQAKARYHHPHNLRVMSLMKRYGEELAETLAQIRDALAAEGDMSALPATLVRGTYADY
jgi:hypothetical protein